jgi:site-specific recombinase XerD
MPKLPLTTRRFLTTPRGEQSRVAILALHRWLEWRGISIAQLTPVLFQQFLTWPNHVRVSAKTRRAYWIQLRDYLQRLRDRGMLSFNPKHLQRRPRSLPPIAREYLASLAPTHRPSTCSGYATTLRGFYAWLDDNRLDVAQLTQRVITRWFQSMHAERLAPITRHGILMETRMYLRWLNERQPMRTLPDDLIRRSDFPKLPHYMPRPLTIEADRELQRRLAASDDPRAWALLLMRRTGLRISELYNLEYHCTRFERRQPLLKVPLGKLHSERLVPLDPDAVELVRRLQSTGPRPRAWLVPGRNHSKCNFDELSDVLKVASRDSPDPARITSHRLRHTFATELLSAGMSLVGVMRLLGHRDHRMTLRYAAVTPETVAEEYQSALSKVAAKYRLAATPAAAPPGPEDASQPDQLLDHLARWVRKHAAPRDLLRRIERLKRDILNLTPPTKK